MRGGTRPMTRIPEKRAKLWHLSQRMWVWKWQTLTAIQRSAFYVMDNGNYVLGQGHRVLPVYNYVTVNPKVPKLKICSEYHHCMDCKLMGTIETFQQYSCH